MNISCPVLRDKGARRCDGELEVELELTSNGDGVYSESGYVALVECNVDGDAYCSEGCKLTPEQVEKVEQDALESYASGY